MPTLPLAEVYVVGSGPNGLAAAVTMARAGRSTVLVERAETLGGGLRSAELTRPGFVHDICAEVMPLGVGSPLFAQLPLAEHGLEWVHPAAPLAHPFDDGTAVLLERSLWTTACGLGEDQSAYEDLMAPFVHDWHKLAEDILSPMYLPHHPIVLAKFAWRAIHSAEGLVQRWFRGTRARALIAGMAAHAFLPLDAMTSGAYALVLGLLGHAVGWPFVRGGSQRLADALAAWFRRLGGQVITGRHIGSLRHLPRADVALLDVSPKSLERIAGWWLPRLYRRQLQHYRYGPGVFKIDWALNGSIPWRAAECARAGTVHLGGTFEQIAATERAVSRGEHPDQPLVILAQPSLFDPTRCPAGAHTAWAYCHVPNGSKTDMTARIEAQVERFAPGFTRRIEARHTMTAVQMERYNPNYVGGDVNGGLSSIRQLLTRPVVRHDPYSTPVRGLFLCSASTPPGGGVHGMCGYHAAQSALRYLEQQERADRLATRLKARAEASASPATAGQ